MGIIDKKKRRRRLREVFLLTLCAALLTAGCQALNDNENNERVWFPSLVQPGYLNPAHERWAPEGSDPFPSASASRSAVQPRPQYWDLPRSWNADVTGNKTIKVIPSEAATLTPQSTATLTPQTSATLTPQSTATLQP